MEMANTSNGGGQHQGMDVSGSGMVEIGNQRWRWPVPGMVEITRNGGEQHQEWWRSATGDRCARTRDGRDWYSGMEVASTRSGRGWHTGVDVVRTMESGDWHPRMEMASAVDGGDQYPGMEVASAGDGVEWHMGMEVVSDMDSADSPEWRWPVPAMVDVSTKRWMYQDQGWWRSAVRVEVASARDGGDWYPRMDASGPGIVETGTQERRWLIPWMVISAQGWKWPVLGVLEMGTAQTWLFSAPSPGQRQPRWDSLQADRLQGTGDE